MHNLTVSQKVAVNLATCRDRLAFSLETPISARRNAILHSQVGATIRRIHGWHVRGGLFAQDLPRSTLELSDELFDRTDAVSSAAIFKLLRNKALVFIIVSRLSILLCGCLRLLQD